MTPKEWKHAVTVELNQWFRRIRGDVIKGALKIDGRYSYPTHIRIAASPTHFIAEVYGSQSAFDALLTEPAMLETFPSTSGYFNPGSPASDDDPGTIMCPDGGIVSNLLGSTTYDEAVFRDKIGYPLAGARFQSYDRPNVITIGPQIGRLLLREMDFIRSDGIRVWLRTVQFAIVLRREVSAVDFRSWLQEQMWSMSFVGNGISDLLGMNFSERFTNDPFGRELSSLADQDVDEAVLDTFIRHHKDQFARALGRKRAIAQPRLTWVRRDEKDPEISIPDYALERGDGGFDLLDLKRGLLWSKRLFRGRRARMHFGSYVQELIGQLSGYARYFSHDENRRYALDTYGIRVDVPRLIGIVGNYDNLKRDDLELALENHRRDLTIMSYTDLVNLHRARINAVA